MKYVFFDAKTGLSGDMILGALLDLGIKPALFRSKMAGLKLPVRIDIKDVERSHFRGLKVDIHVQGRGSHARKWKDIAALIKKSRFFRGRQGPRTGHLQEPLRGRGQGSRLPLRGYASP